MEDEPIDIKDLHAHGTSHQIIQVIRRVGMAGADGVTVTRSMVFQWLKEIRETEESEKKQRETNAVAERMTTKE
jgi:hypothetical protein